MSLVGSRASLDEVLTDDLYRGHPTNRRINCRAEPAHVQLAVTATSHCRQPPAGISPTPTGSSWPPRAAVWRDAGLAWYHAAALPFTLKKSNQNCVHYGLMRLRNRCGGSRDCMANCQRNLQYLKFNASGTAGIRLQPQRVDRRQELITNGMTSVNAGWAAAKLWLPSATTTRIELSAFMPPLPADDTFTAS